MRLLVHGRSLVAGAGASRMRMAAGGLALRGHQVLWRGDNPPFDGAIERVASSALGWAEGSGDSGASPPPDFSRIARVGGGHADLALGGAPIATAIAGWRSRVDAMVVTADAAAIERWSAIDHWCWESLESLAVLDVESHGEVVPEALGLEADRVLTWSRDPPPSSPDPTHADVEILERACERLLARRSGRLARPAVFLDRDGTLVVERGYLDQPDGIELLPGVDHALRTLARAGFALVVISNQSGVGRGLFPLATVYATMAALRHALRGHGVEIDAVYFCPHHPEERCDCRKPGTALLTEAARSLSLDLRRSTMIGDKLLDAATAQNAGGRGVLVRTGYGREEARRHDPGSSQEPDRVCETLTEAAEWIIERRAGSTSD